MLFWYYTICAGLSQTITLNAGDILNDNTVLVYLPLKPEMAKANNLPVKLPVLAEDLPSVVDKDRIDIDIILRGLEAQYRIKPDDYYGSYLLFYYYEALKRSLNRGFYEEAKGFLDLAGSLSVDYRYFFYKGLCHRENGEYEYAEVELRKAVEMNSDFYIGYYEIGRLLQLKAEYEDAATFHLLSIEKSDGQFSLPFLGVVDAYISQGAYDSALEVIDRLGASFPLHSDALLRKGVLLNELQRFREAERVFISCLESDDNMWQCYYNIAYSRSKLGMLFEALQDLRSAYSISRAPDILYEIAIAEKNLGLLEEAVIHSGEYYRLTGEEKGLVLQARLLYMSCEYEKALECLEGKDYAELRNTIVFHWELEKGKVESELAFEEPLTQAIYLEMIKKELYPIKKTEALRFISRGKLDFEKLIEFLLSAGESFSDLIERVSAFAGGRIPKSSRSIKTEELGLFVSALLSLEGHIPMQQSLSYAMGFFMSGKGVTTAVFRILLHLFMWSETGLSFSIDLFLDEYLEEIKDLDFQFGIELARLTEEGAVDIDTLEEAGLEGLDIDTFVMILLSAMEKGTIEELKIEEGSLKEYINSLCRR